MNILLALLSLDFVFRGVILYPAAAVSFARVGYVSSDTAKILIREPNLQNFPLSIKYRQLGDGQDDSWNEFGAINSADETTDYTVPITLRALEPAKTYRYSVSNSLSGEFTTSPEPGSPDSRHLTFWTSSCIKANFPYNIFSHPYRIPGIEFLAEVTSKLASSYRPSFMLFLGDFIYIDVPRRFGSSVAHYRDEYQKVYSSPSWHKGPYPPINLPWIHMLDDHEIANDWHSGNNTEPYLAAVDPFLHYHVSVNPPIPEAPYSTPSNTTYFSFTNGPASFFVLDSRTYRNEPSQNTSTMLGSAQLHSLLDFISRPEPSGVKWKIISSSVPFTKNWHIGTPDTWGGYLDERQAVFEAIWRAERESNVRIVLLSGDRHEFAATRFPDPDLPSKDTSLVPGAGPGIHEFCVGPLSQFYLPSRTCYQDDDEDVIIKYIPAGNYKFGAITIDDDADGVSQLTFSLYVDGEVMWEYKLSAPRKSKKEKAFPDGEILLDNEKPWPEGVRRALAVLTEFGAFGTSILKRTFRQGWELFLKHERVDE